MIYGISCLCSGQNGVKCTVTPIWAIKWTVVLIRAGLRKLVHSGSLLSPACVESCGIEMCPSSTQATHPPSTRPLTPLPPKPVQTQFTSTLDGAHQESLRAAKSVISLCGTMYVNISIYIFSLHNYFLVEHSSNILSANIDCYYLLRLINWGISYIILKLLLWKAY